LLTDDNKSILIPGGSGFHGINLVRYLLQKGFNKLTVLDICDFDYPDVKDTITFVRRDIRDKQIVERAMSEVRWVVHTDAALPLYKEEDIYSTEVEGTKVLFETALT